MELEAYTIRAVRHQMPSVSVPEVIYSGLDRAWNRSFLLSKRVFDETLGGCVAQALDPSGRKECRRSRQHISTLSEFTFTQFKTITRYGVNGEKYLLGTADLDTWRHGKPVIRPISTPETMTTLVDRSETTSECWLCIGVGPEARAGGAERDIV